MLDSKARTRMHPTIVIFMKEHSSTILFKEQ